MQRVSLLRPAVVVTALTVAFAGTPAFAGAAKAAGPMRSAAPTGELEERRTRSSSTVRNADGTLTTTLHAGAVHYRDTRGSWRPIKSDVVEERRDGFAYRNAANAFTVRWKDRLDGEYLGFTADGVDFRLALKGAAAAAARAAKHGVAYANAVGGVELRYDMLADGVKETLVLPDASVPTRYSFTLRATGTAPVRAVERPDRSWAFFVGAGLKPAFVLDAPSATDAAGARQESPVAKPNATLDVRQTGRSFTVDLAIDPVWLHASERTFPVLLDPTITIQPPIEDVSYPPTCANCVPYVSDKVFMGTDTSNAWRGAVQFNIGEIPAGADVTNADLQLYWGVLCITVPTQWCNGTSHQVDAHRATAGWSTSTLASGFTYDATPLGSFTVSGSNAMWMTWPVTSTLRDWLAGTTANFGVVLKRNIEPLGASGPVAYGRRYAEPALQPKLVVTYPGDGVNLLPPDTLHSNGADLRWTPYPADALTPFDRYEVHRSATASFTPTSSTLLTTIRDAAVTSYRDTTAAPNKTFTYKVVANTVASTGRTVTLPATGQATKLLQPSGTDGVATTAVYSTTLVNCANYGSEDTIWIGPGSTTNSRGLVKFDLRDVPETASITSATMSLWHAYKVSHPVTVRAYASTAEWREGTGLSTCTNDGATWYDAHGGVKWANLGTDSEGLEVASAHSPISDPAGFDTFDLTSAVKRWVAGTTPNHGVMLKADDEVTGDSTKLHSYYSDDFAVAPSLRPKLAVTYADGSAAVGPTMAVSAPGDATGVSGSVTFAATATDDRRVDKVEFLVDGAVVATDLSEPFAATWKTYNHADGTHSLVVRGTDDAGNVTSSPAVTVTVDNSAAPTVDVTAPALPAFETYAGAVQADAPSGWWRLGDPAGQSLAADSAGTGTGTATGVTFGVAGATKDGNTAARFSGVNGASEVRVPTSAAVDPSTGDFTVEAWVKTAVNGEGAIVGKHQTGVLPSWRVTVTNDTGYVGRVRAVVEDATGTRTGYGPAIRVDDNVWHHVVVGFDRDRGFVISVDGYTAETTASIAASVSNPADLRIGDFNDYPALAADIDEVALYHKLLPADRVKAHLEAGLQARKTAGAYDTTVKADAPLGYWRLGEVSGTTFADSSVTARAGSAVGTPTLNVPGALSRDGDGALQVNTGANDYVTVPSNPAYDLNGSFTLEWWGAGLANQTSSYPGFLRYGDGGVAGAGWLVWWSPSSGRLYFKRDGLQWNTSTGVVTTSWRHLAITYDQPTATLTFYVDGLAHKVSTGVTFAAGAASTSGLKIGSGDQASGGRVDEAAIYTTALSADRIRAHYDAATVDVPVVRGTTTIGANAADDKGVTKVEFLVDGVRVGEDTVAPYSVSWNTLDGANPVYDGVRIVTAVAHDAGKSTTSASWPVRVDNTPAEAIVDTTPPPITVVSGSTEKAGLDVTLTNTGTGTWSATGHTVGYQWISQDPTPVVVEGTGVPLGADVGPGASRKVRLDVTPPTIGDGTTRAQYTLRVDLKDSSGTYAASRGNKPKENPVVVAKALEDALGLERFYQYRGEELGAGMQHLVNVANGNSLWRWTPFSSPGRGINTNLDLTYNSLEKHSNSPAGNNVSISLSSLTRFGTPLDIHPNKADQIAGNANRYVVFVDGDGTSHRFDGFQAADGTVYWASPPGVHLYLRSLPAGDPKRAWALTRPDRITYVFDSDGFPTSVEDNNGNKLTFTVEDIPPGEDGGPIKKRITAVTDAAGSTATPAPNRTFRIDYYSKAEVKKQQVRGRIQRITDHTGSALDFEYYDDGNLRKLIQRGGTTADGAFLPDRSFVFTYTTSNAEGPAIPDPAKRVDPDPKTPNQSSLIYSIRDPRGTETRFDYYGPGTAQLRERLESMTNRVGSVTTYGYDLVARKTTITAPLSRVTSYLYDTTGRATSITNPKNETTTLTWNADNKVTKVTEPTGAAVSYTYNDNGYVTSTTDQVGNSTQITYENVAVDANDVAGKWETGRTVPHISQIRFKTNPNGVATATVGDYQYEFKYDTKGNLVEVVDPLGHRTLLGINTDGTVRSETSPNGGVTSYVYDANGLPTKVTDPLGRVTTSFYDDDGLLRWRQDARHQGATGSNTREYRNWFDYDSFHRLGRQSAPKSTDVERGTLIWTGAQFDPNDNVTLDVAPHYGRLYAPSTAFRTTRTYDAMDQQTLVTTSDTSADPAGERTKFELDAASRVFRITRPRGMQSATIGNDFVTELTYDVLDRVVREKRDEVDPAGVVKSTQYTWKCYQANSGDLTRMVLPRANRALDPCADGLAKPDRKFTYDAAHRILSEQDGNGNTTSRTYDRNSNVVSMTNAMGTTTRYEFDQRDQRTRIIQPFVGGTAPRDIVTKYEYDPAGNRTALISPRAWDASTDKVTFTQYVTRYVFDPANQLTRIDLPKTGTADAAYVHRRYDPNGYVNLMTQPVREIDLANVAPDRKTEYTHFDPGWIRTENDNVNPRVHHDYTAEGWPASRTPQKKGSADLDTTQRMHYAYYPDGQLRERGDAGGQKVSYTYDANNNVLTIRDSNGVTSNGQKTMEIVNTWDGLDRNTVTKQRRQGQNWKITTFGFNLHGDVDYREDNREETDAGAVVKAGRKSRFVYDNADWMQQQTDEGDDRQASTSDDQRILNAFYPTGWEKTRTIQRLVSGAWQTKQTTDWTHYLNGSLKTLVTKNGSGTILESHDVSYTDALNRYVNGHKTKDVFQRSGGATCTTTCTQTHEYDAQDRVVKEFNGATTTTYDLDAAGNVKTETSGGVTTTYTYKGNQIDTVSSGGVTSKYVYDTRGNLDCVTSGATSCGGGTLADYNYDYLDRLTSFTSPGESASYEYDALDRMAQQRETHSGVSRVTDLSYLGTTSAVSFEEHRGSVGGTVNRTKSYSYDAFGNAISMTDKQGTTNKDYNYGYDVQGNVSQLNDASTGQTFAAYGYKPYGDQDNGLAKGDTDLKNPVNPMRFMAKRYDSGSGTVDMGARRFGPRDSHFLQEDRLHGALANMDLGTDPLTSNRYSLAGGNPTSFVEVDGHWSIGDLFGGGSKDGNPLDSIKKKAKNFFNKAKQTAKKAVSKVGDFAKGVADKAVDSAKETGIGDVANEVAGAVGDVMDEAPKKVGRTLARAGAKVGNAVEDVLEGTTETISKFARRGNDAIQRAGKAIGKWGSKVPDQLEDGIRNAAKNIDAKWIKRAGRVLDWGSNAIDVGMGAVSQWQADAGKGLSKLERGLRAGGRGLIEGGSSMAGSWAVAAGCVALGAATAGLVAAGCAVAGGIAGGIGGDMLADTAFGDD